MTGHVRPESLVTISGIRSSLAAILTRSAARESVSIFRITLPLCASTVISEMLSSPPTCLFLYRVQAAKKPETRAERITRLVDLCARHETIHPRRQTRAGAGSRGASKKARTKE